MDLPTSMEVSIGKKLQPRCYGQWAVVYEGFEKPAWMEFHTKSLYFGDLMARRSTPFGTEFIRQPVYIPAPKLKKAVSSSALKQSALLEEMLDIANGRINRSMDRANTGAFKPEIEIRPPKLTPADWKKARFVAQ